MRAVRVPMRREPRRPGVWVTDMWVIWGQVRLALERA